MSSSYSKSQIAQREHLILSCLLKNAKDSIYFKDLDSRFICLSYTLAESFGLKAPEQAIGMTDFDFFSPQHAQKAYNDEQKIIATAQPIIDVIEEEVWPNKESTWVSTTKTPFRNEQGNIIGTFGISRNITKRRKAENERDQLQIELQHARKMESIGHLAAGIAHEVNTPSQYVSDNLSFLNKSFNSLSSLLTILQDTKELPPHVQAAMDNIDMTFLLEEIPLALAESQEGTQRISKIVKAMNFFSHPSQGKKQETTLKSLVETAATLSNNEWSKVAELVIDTEDNLVDVPCIIDELSQAIVILIVNAAQAIDNKREQEPNKKGTINITLQQEGSWTKIKISDNGCGIPKSIQSKVFDPFFTTKEVGKGTGQGLSIAYKIIVEKHEGKIFLESEENQGACFHIWLPQD